MKIGGNESPVALGGEILFTYLAEIPSWRNLERRGNL
jgi:hypothetical protein